jgi:hypothetical protein
MRIVDIGPKPGRVWELEVSNLIGRRRLVRRLGAIPGLRILQGPKWLSMFREEVFCRFEFGERCFVAEAGETGGYRIRPERPDVFRNFWRSGMHCGTTRDSDR